jgi:hypothetical protein
MSIKSIQQTEQEAASMLPSGYSLDDVYGPIKTAINAIFQSDVKSSNIPSDEAAKNEFLLTETANKVAQGEEDTAGYYKFISRDGVEGAAPEDEMGEKYLLSEIEKFRLRQLQRDK